MSAEGSSRRRAFALVAGIAALPALAAEPPPVQAPSWILVEQDSGTVLAAHDADTPRPPASVTKIMTGFVVFEAIEAGEVRLDDRARISRKAWKAGRAGSRSFVRQGSRVPVDDLLRGMAVHSGNDSAMALAERVGGSEAMFVARMNAASERLGLTQTQWANSTGLDSPDQRASARDLATLTRALIARFPFGYRYYGEYEFEWDGVKQHSRNPLLRRAANNANALPAFDGADGVKTGFTAAAGYCMVGSSTRGELRLIVVLLGSASNRSRAADARALLEWGYSEAAGKTAEPLLDSNATTPSR